jgi:CHAT domain-containing protein
VLSMVDQAGKPQNGFLQLHDIYNLELPVDLVVLSACNSALGKDVRGEGLIGLTRGFMYAGASGVVASLWKVDDDATAELMKHFYAAVFRKKLAPAAALRDAQLAMQRQKRWESPYYWAGFVIQGNYDVPAQRQESHFATSARYLLGGLAICAMILATILALGQRRGRII